MSLSKFGSSGFAKMSLELENCLMLFGTTRVWRGEGKNIEIIYSRCKIFLSISTYLRGDMWRRKILEFYYIYIPIFTNFIAFKDIFEDF